MLTERYSVTFLGLDPGFHTARSIADIWEIGANEVYEETGIYITGSIDANYIVSQAKSTMDSREISYTIVSIRNPSFTYDDDTYWEAYKRIIEQVRGRLGNPSMTITKHDVEFYYFIDI